MNTSSTAKSPPRPDFCIVIPARFASKRLPGKPLREIAGKPMIQHVYEMALACQSEQVVVATDSNEIFECVQGFGGMCFLSSSEHKTGSDRVAEVAAELAWGDDRIVVNLQGDALLIEPEDIQRLVDCLREVSADMATLVKPLEPDDFNNPGAVKVVRDLQKFALYFSRANIPWQQHNGQKVPEELYLHHMGVYACRCAYLGHFTQLPQTPLEQCEGLEQLRVLEHHGTIYVENAISRQCLGIDTEQDLQKAKKLLE